MFRHLDTSPTTQVAEIMVKHWRSSASSWTKFVRSPTCGTLVVETVWGGSVGTWMGKRTELEMSICSSKTRIILIGKRGCKMAAKKQNVAPMWKKVMELVDLDEPTSFLGHENLGCTQREPNEIDIEYQEMFEPRISAGTTEKSPGCEQPHAKTIAWSYDMEGHAQKCVERYCELANKKTEQLYKVSSLCLDDHHFKKEELESDGVLSKVCSQIVLMCLSRSVTKWTGACDRRFARLISYIHHTNDLSCVKHGSALSNWVHSKTQLLLVTLRTQNQLRRESYVSLEVEHLSPSVGCVRNKRQFSTFLQNQKSRWIAGLRMGGLLALDFWDVVIEVIRSPNSTKPPTSPAAGNCSQNHKSKPEQKGTKMLINCRTWTTIPQTQILLKASVSFTSLKTMKQWSKWS